MEIKLRLLHSLCLLFTISGGEKTLLVLSVVISLSRNMDSTMHTMFVVIIQYFGTLEFGFEGTAKATKK